MNADSYLDQKEEYLLTVEDEIRSAVEPDLNRAIDDMAALPLDAADSDFERVLTPLNDRLRNAIAEALFLHQFAMAEMAVNFYPGKPTPMLSPEDLLKEIKMAGTSFFDWFRRRSPSRWMADVLKATPKELRHTVETAISTAVWATAARQEQFSWNRASAYRWITRPELSATGTCGVCAPLDGRVEKRVKDFPLQLPAHPHCHCGIVPTTV